MWALPVHVHGGLVAITALFRQSDADRNRSDTIAAHRLWICGAPSALTRRLAFAATYGQDLGLRA